MSNQFKEVLSTRWFRNVLFWIFAMYFIYEVNVNADDYDRGVYLGYKAITTALLLIMTCVNNFLLMPRLWAKKKKLLHLFAVFILLGIISLAYVLLLKNMLLTYPKIKVYEVSIITSPITTEFSLSAILDDMATYAFGLGMWLATFTMAWYMNDYTRQQKLAKDALLKQRETELNMLRNQVNPHFLFNTLNNIYGLALAKSDDAPESILKLSSIMRYMLYDSDAPKMPVEKEKQVMQAYIDMELLRLPKSDNLKFSIESDKNYNIPTLIWLPILENVFKHATRVITDDYFINYSFAINNNVLTIVSENSYKESPEQNGGVGLNNLRKRLAIIYPKSHHIEETRADNKYCIKLTVNL